MDVVEDIYTRSEKRDYPFSRAYQKDIVTKNHAIYHIYAKCNKRKNEFFQNKAKT